MLCSLIKTLSVEKLIQVFWALEKEEGQKKEAGFKPGKEGEKKGAESGNLEAVKSIAKRSGKTEEEVLALVGEKKKKFSGLLTGSGAAFMVAKDLGVELGTESVKRVLVSHLRDGMQNVDLVVRVLRVFSPKEFEKEGKKGKLCNLIVADSTGEIRLTVWHGDVEKVQKGVKPGSVLLLKNCFVKDFNEKPQLSLGYKGSFEINPKNAAFADLPKFEERAVKIGSLEKGMNNVRVLARVIRVYPETSFEKEGRKGNVVNFLVGDETGTLRATAWNDLVKEAKLLEENDLVWLEGCYTKPGLKGLELHLGWQARIVKSRGFDNIPSAGEMQRQNAVEKKIIDLKEGEGNVLLGGKIVMVNPGKLFYNVCPKCGGKIQRLDEGILCDKCGEVKEPGIRAVISVRVDDGSAQVNAVAYGKEAEKIMGFGKEELGKRVKEEGIDRILDELKERLNEKQVEVLGKAKQNSFTGEFEFSVNRVELK